MYVMMKWPVSLLYHELNACGILTYSTLLLLLLLLLPLLLPLLPPSILLHPCLVMYDVPPVVAQQPIGSWLLVILSQVGTSAGCCCCCCHLCPGPSRHGRMVTCHLAVQHCAAQPA
jgi:hypothetical protein